MGWTTRTMTGPTKAVGSIRVSTDTQADHGISLDVQQAMLPAYAQLSLELGEVPVEASGSATTLERPGFQGALGLVCQRSVWGALRAWSVAA